MDAKLLSWLTANKIIVNDTCSNWGGLFLFITKHNARALICLYLLTSLNNKFTKLLVRKFLRSHYHIECSCKTIGYNFMLPHPMNIIIGAESIGDNVQINQNTTIGGNMKKIQNREWGEQKLPIIKNNVVIYTNAVVGGPVIIEDNVIIGANCTCTHDVPSNSLIYNKQCISGKRIIVNNGSFSYL